ncbi:VTT domain-containing protein [Mycobacterium sp. CPCC 205372]|uniref:VTT domain-containing protein n=1 Tax=Mycobacterium hippophais TaxID=3016340 RepID=A0ABT4PM96_9MYCO|nr:VTT domain-containing protein [Mycobacterium hippophais]MCZ8377616.1 VTT domain-containing protein [Mycobacterium hippophais]
MILAAGPEFLDPMYWLGEGGLFASAIVVGVMVIVFIECGLFFPFLPGDTLLFTAGVIAAQAAADVSIWTLMPCATVAAIAGSQCSYLVGRRIGPRLYERPDSRIYKRRYLTESHDFFARYGPKILTITPFIGVVRTFTPVVAGIAGMRHTVFTAFNAIGCVIWGFGLPAVGYRLGNVPFVSRHLELLVLGIACLSSLPVIVSVTKVMLTRRRRAADPEAGSLPADVG